MIDKLARTPERSSHNAPNRLLSGGADLSLDHWLVYGTGGVAWTYDKDL
jgi:hypothetical protein